MTDPSHPCHGSTMNALKNLTHVSFFVLLIIDDVKNFDVKQFNFLENNNELDDLYCLSQCDSVVMSNDFFLVGSLVRKKKEK